MREKLLPGTPVTVDEVVLDEQRFDIVLRFRTSLNELIDFRINDDTALSLFDHGAHALAHFGVPFSPDDEPDLCEGGSSISSEPVAVERIEFDFAVVRLYELQGLSVVPNPLSGRAVPAEEVVQLCFVQADDERTPGPIAPLLTAGELSCLMENLLSLLATSGHKIEIDPTGNRAPKVVEDWASNEDYDRGLGRLFDQDTEFN